jgi:cyclophilin family peptidyl-prolyl cis-trans isomerase
MKGCPFCGAEIKKGNFNKHLRKVHADLDEKEFKEKGVSKPIAIDDSKKREREDRKRMAVIRQKKTRVVEIIIFILGISVAGVIVMSQQNMIPGIGPGGGGTVAVVKTSLGEIKIQLYTDKAPKTADNFINLAKSGFYNGLIFHRIIKDFMIQGGGYYPNQQEKQASQVDWEKTGLKNLKYTISMARVGGNVNSATCQFFINTKDNAALDSPQGEESYPYVVFGKVIGGFSVVDAIESLPTGTTGAHENWPNNPPVINSVAIQ